MTYKLCKAPMTLRIELTGGCQCKKDSSDYCYCDSPDVRCYWKCTSYTEEVSTGKRPREIRRYCGADPVTIHELGDYGAIERWLQANYTHTATA